MLKQHVKKSILKRAGFSNLPENLGDLLISDLLHLLKYIDQLQKKGAENAPFFFTSKIEYLDRLWHEFILHSQDYVEYCDSNFGGYLHHSPFLEMHESTQGIASLSEIIKKQIDELTEVAGADFVNRVFFTYPEIIEC